MKKSGKMLIMGITAVMAMSMCACGNNTSEAAFEEYAENFASMSEDEQEASITNVLNAMDAENEREEAEKEAEEQAEAEAEAAAMEEAKNTVADYSAADISLTDIDPVTTGAGDMIGLDFSTFPASNGSFAYTWNYTSYSGEPEISDVTGEPYETAKWYRLTMVADGSMYQNFKTEVKDWVESQNLIAESNTSANDPGCSYGGSFYWLSTDKAVEFKIDGNKISFTAYCLKTYHYEGTVSLISRVPDFFESDTPVESIFVKPDEDMEDVAAGTEITYMYIDPVTEEDYDAIMNNGAKPLNGTDLTQYIDLDSDLQEGDQVCVDVVSISAIKNFAAAYLVDGEDFLQLSVHKIG